MAGRAFFKIEIDGDPKEYEIIATFTGGATQPKTREVPETNLGGTMREEATGGVMREDIELTFIEREDEGLLLDDLYVSILAWRDTEDASQRRRGLSAVLYSDRKLTKVTGRLEVTGAWPKIVSVIELDRSSDDPRQFSATLTHLGSEYKSV